MHNRAANQQLAARSQQPEASSSSSYSGLHPRAATSRLNQNALTLDAFAKSCASTFKLTGDRFVPAQRGAQRCRNRKFELRLGFAAWPRPDPISELPLEPTGGADIWRSRTAAFYLRGERQRRRHCSVSHRWQNSDHQLRWRMPVRLPRLPDERRSHSADRKLAKISVAKFTVARNRDLSGRARRVGSSAEAILQPRATPGAERNLSRGICSQSFAGAQPVAQVGAHGTTHPAVLRNFSRSA